MRSKVGRFVSFDLGDAPRPREVKVSRSPDFSARSHQAYGALQCDVAAAAVTSVVCAAICLWRSESDHFLAVSTRLAAGKEHLTPSAVLAVAYYLTALKRSSPITTALF
ncbi:Tetraacyldisaccharide 4'-kinase [Frankliniella fusca]|uniref:Tetraacyldisaccharide 4'-kinase n=1 Tax=Frankliniella fusca TaxID=407009 RepID=A0AAE1HVF7_9NEOP|nr:Tetraacyldisaccharide 4'-kinase [Frankliniella fusca]KAK3920409.1 Tetraacyldisaccharide 4'-kinase [Frankliniella fusca]KAK3922534.1 Tetraacyldisaccharide 4'-kinase [Frankliniella fusca]KAK3928168.1 Tetraacyldisaccharide 4'-kinase [Frankliniella fusca]KAK3928695.1 Tetraacyldisaccharide 4'-kinase [Frankliniella fusca]